MGFEEKSILCVDCHKNFIFTVKAHDFYASMGFPNDPIRCTLCRRSRKQHTQHEPGERTTTTARSDKYFR